MAITCKGSNCDFRRFVTKVLLWQGMLEELESLKHTSASDPNNKPSGEDWWSVSARHHAAEHVDPDVK
jgi:hypothetical protein